MSKTTLQVSSDCALTVHQHLVLNDIIEKVDVPESVVGDEQALCEIIGALYRRIEKLEEQKDCECGWAAAKEWESEFNKTKTQLDRADREIERLNLMVSMLSKEEV